MSAIQALKKDMAYDGKSPWSFYRKVLLYSFIVSGCITIPFIIVELIRAGSAVFLYYGDYNAQQICFYRHCVEMVHSGNFGWDWTTDLGANFVGSYSYYMLGSPFFWLICAFPSSWTPYLMAPMYMIKYMVAGITAYAYLQRFVKNKDYAVIGALLYSFSGFQIYNTFFNQFHDVVAFFPLLLIGMEELVQNDRRGLFAVAVTINAMINYFMFAGQVVFCMVYFLFRLSTRSFKIDIPKFIRLIIEAVLGFAMSMFIFLPAAGALMGNSRIERSFTGTIAEFFTNLINFIFKGGKWDAVVEKFKALFIYRKSGEFYWQRYGQIFESYFFPPDIPSRVNFFYGHETRWASISMYLPMFAMNGVFALYTVKGRKWLKKLMVFLFVCSLVPVLNSIFFLFNSSYYARWLYMMIMMFTLATTVALEDSRTKWVIPAGISTVICTAVAVPLGLLWLKDADKDDAYRLGHPPFMLRFCIYVAIAFLGTALTVWLIRKYRGTKLFAKAVTVAVCCMTVLYGCIHITNGKMYGSDSHFLVDQAINGEVELPDPHEEFYRIDFYRTSSTSTLDNLGIYWEYPSIECFHTVVPPSIMEFYPKIGVTRDVGSRAESKLYGLRGFTSTKYSFIRTGTNNRRETSETTEDENGNTVVTKEWKQKHDTYGFNYYDTQNKFDIYENECYIPMGFSYDEFMTEKDFEKIYSKNERHAVLCSYLVVPDSEAEYYSKILKRVSVGDEHVSATKSSYSEATKQRAKESCDSFEYSSDGFKAHYVSDKTRIVFFSVPYESDGWTATVNGKDTDVLKVFYGFVAVEVPAGESDIVFDYNTPGFKVGCTLTVGETSVKLPGGLWISLIALALYIIYMIYNKLIEKHKAESVFFSNDYFDGMDAYDEEVKAEETGVETAVLTAVATEIEEAEAIEEAVETEAEAFEKTEAEAAEAEAVEEAVEDIKEAKEAETGENAGKNGEE